MKEWMERICRPCGKWTDIFLIAGLASVFLAIMGSLLSEAIFKVLGAEQVLTGLFGDADIAVFLLMYFTFFGIWILFFVVITVFKSNRPIWTCLSFRRGGNSLRGLLAGLALGVGTNAFCVLMSCLLGDLKLTYRRFDPVLLLSFFFVVMVQSGAEEIMDRCYVYQKLRRRYRHPAVAVVFNSLLFMALHLGNDNVSAIAIIQLVVIALIFSLIVYYYDCLWAAIMFHTGWNFTQSILFGLPNSGVVSKYSLFVLDAASARNGLFYNVGFGVEGSVGAVVLQGIVLLLILVINRGRRERRDIWRGMEAAVERGREGQG